MLSFFLLSLRKLAVSHGSTVAGWSNIDRMFVFTCLPHPASQTLSFPTCISTLIGRALWFLLLLLPSFFPFAVRYKTPLAPILRLHSLPNPICIERLLYLLPPCSSNSIALSLLPGQGWRAAERWKRDIASESDEKETNKQC